MHVRLLNMARRLRPVTFDQVKGQELSLSMLKNSLYSNVFFPTYLFTGQRGCGKTTTGRIFAAALNCEKLEEFQKNPSQRLPCQECPSCVMMLEGSHPDFVEMDAASHTGVDDVRAMLDAACYVPLQGRKKIYLIDEAHMLSKAAFNALLKMLEEPPKTALFMLATTEFNKVPATVRSRCFQVHFNALKTDILVAYLQEVAEQEKLALDPGAAQMIISLSERCVRDALNMLEQVSFVSQTITESVVMETLGMFSKEYFFTIIEFVLKKEVHALIAWFERYPLSLDQTGNFVSLLIHFFRALVRVHHKIPLTQSVFVADEERLVSLVEMLSFEEIRLILKSIWDFESLLYTASQKDALLEHLLLKITMRDFAHSLPSATDEKKIEPKNEKFTSAPQNIRSEKTATSGPKASTAAFKETNFSAQWKTFVRAVMEKNRMLGSILGQAQPDESSESPNLHIFFSVKSGFFKEKIAELQEQWQPMLVELCAPFTGIIVQERLEGQKVNQPQVSVHMAAKVETKEAVPVQVFQQVRRQKIAFDENALPAAAQLVKEFPGTVEVVDLVKNDSA